MYRIKFRIHGGQKPGKFVYNVPADATLFLNPVFRPVAAGEAPSYSLRASNGQTEITFHQSAGWNGRRAAAGSYEVRAGHILTSAGITVEILECPEKAADPGRENTQFLDLGALAPAPEMPSGRIESSSVAPLEMAAPEPAPAPVLEKFENIVPPPEEAEPEPALVEAPPVFRLPPKPAAPEIDSMSARNDTVKKAAYIACGFLGGMILANQVAQRFTFDIDVPEPVVNIVQVPVRPHHAPPQPVALAAPQPIPLEPLPVLPALEGDRAPASAPPSQPLADQQRGASLAALGRDLMSAVEEGNLKKVQKLVDEDGVSPDFTIDDLGRSPFVRAAASGRVSVMQFLVTKKVAITAIDYNGNNALMWSAINGHEKTAAYLLTLGIDASAKREDGKTALSLAKQYRQKSIEGLLARIPASAPQRK